MAQPHASTGRGGRSYANPVHDGYLADPFVWKHRDVYYAIGTGGGTAGDLAQGTPTQKPDVDVDGDRVFPVLRSDDFVHWTSVHQAMVRPDHRLGSEFWAPSVAEAHGCFYLYYSVGPGHQLRVATSVRPEGPYRDTGTPMMAPGTMPFAIDTHPFRDDDGTWYLFYARDFADEVDGCRAGTALVVDRMIGMTRLAGEERVVLRARHDWQLFRAKRPMYGKIWDWHTLEGPCVVKHDGRYYCIYSGACFGNDSYGVDYAVADSVLGPYSDAGGEAGPRILRTIPGKVIGPGHNSLVVGPDGITEYLAYHAWDPAMTARRMHLDRLEWTTDGPRCTPTWTSQTVGE
ncbi:MAG: family 43 glycosylhydrolase [Planctomycetes bacterium]|nr:family 43 glycosylhydrolase [Planctomycetota bacterium]